MVHLAGRKLKEIEFPVALPAPVLRGLGGSGSARMSEQGQEVREQTVTSSLGRWFWGGPVAWHLQEKQFLLLNCDYCQSADSHLNKDSRWHSLP